MYDLKEDKTGMLMTCLSQAESGLASLHEQLEHAQHKAGTWGLLWDQTIKEKSEMRKGFEGRILELTQLLKESQLRGDLEAQLKEDALRKCCSIPQRVKEELDNYQVLKLEQEKLLSDNIYWSGKFAVLKDATNDTKAYAKDMQD